MKNFKSNSSSFLNSALNSVTFFSVLSSITLLTNSTLVYGTPQKTGKPTIRREAASPAAAETGRKRELERVRAKGLVSGGKKTPSLDAQDFEEQQNVKPASEKPRPKVPASVSLTPEQKIETERTGLVYKVSPQTSSLETISEETPKEVKEELREPTLTPPPTPLTTWEKIKRYFNRDQINGLVGKRPPECTTQGFCSETAVLGQPLEPSKVEGIIEGVNPGFIAPTTSEKAKTVIEQTESQEEKRPAFAPQAPRKRK